MKTLSPCVTASPLVFLAACGAAPTVNISALPDGGAEGQGIPFVVPRSVIKVDSDKGVAGSRIVFTVAPVAYAADGRTVLPRFLLSGSTDALSPAPTSVTSVAYADDLIVKEIGTQVADHRKDAIDVVAGIAAAVVAARAPGDCANPPALRPFVIDDLTPTASRRAPNNACWGYAIQPAAFAPVAMRAYPVDGLAAAGQVGWFPIAACRPYSVTVFQCADAACTAAPGSAVTAVVSASDGTQYRRVPLPVKGSVTLHPDFCQADVTSGSVAGSDWDVLNQVLSDVKAVAK